MMEDFAAIAQRLQAAWAEAFGCRDWEGLAGLYVEQPAFYGSTPELHTTRAGVRAYFEVLPPALTAARYSAPEITRLGQDSFAASGDVVFVVSGDDGDVELPYRMTHVFVRDGGPWRIAAHHASPRPGPLLGS